MKEETRNEMSGVACDLFEEPDIDICATCGEDREWHDNK